MVPKKQEYSSKFESNFHQHCCSLHKPWQAHQYFNHHHHRYWSIEVLKKLCPKTIGLWLIVLWELSMKRCNEKHWKFSKDEAFWSACNAEVFWWACNAEKHRCWKVEAHKQNIRQNWRARVSIRSEGLEYQSELKCQDWKISVKNCPLSTRGKICLQK